MAAAAGLRVRAPRPVARALVAALLLGGIGQDAAAQALAPAAERFAVCLACHGPGGVSQLPLTPSLAGQPSFYAITQLFLFREGRRSSEVMTAVAKGMSDADLRAFSDLIGKLPPPPPPAATAGDPARMARGAVLAERFRCVSCHGGDFAGSPQVPRLAGQREDYLAKALAEFRAGTRLGYTSAMTEALAGIAPDDLAVLASYLAQLPKTGP
jgi:cytochrome c553